MLIRVCFIVMSVLVVAAYGTVAIGAVTLLKTIETAIMDAVAPFFKIV